MSDEAHFRFGSVLVWAQVDAILRTFLLRYDIFNLYRFLMAYNADYFFSKKKYASTCFYFRDSYFKCSQRLAHQCIRFYITVVFIYALYVRVYGRTFNFDLAIRLQCTDLWKWPADPKTCKPTITFLRE